MSYQCSTPQNHSTNIASFSVLSSGFFYFSLFFLRFFYFYFFLLFLKEGILIFRAAHYSSGSAIRFSGRFRDLIIYGFHSFQAYIFLSVMVKVLQKSVISGFTNFIFAILFRLLFKRDFLFSAFFATYHIFSILWGMI